MHAGFQQWDGQCGSGAFAQAQIEIKQGARAELLEEEAVSIFCGTVAEE